MQCKKCAVIGAAFGFVLLIFFGPIFGGAGNDIVAAVYTVLIFPLHIIGIAIYFVAGKPVGEIPYGLLLLLFTLPATYAALAYFLCRLFNKMRRREEKRV